MRMNVSPTVSLFENISQEISSRQLFRHLRLAVLNEYGGALVKLHFGDGEEGEALYGMWL